MVGETEADILLSLCKYDRKTAIKEMGSCCRGRDVQRENYVVRGYENLVSGDQNKVLMKDKRAAYWQRGHSL